MWNSSQQVAYSQVTEISGCVNVEAYIDGMLLSSEFVHILSPAVKLSNFPDANPINQFVRFMISSQWDVLSFGKINRKLSVLVCINSTQ